MKVFDIQEVEELKERFPGWRSYIATAIEPDVTTTVFFYQPNIVLAEIHVEKLFPGCTFKKKIRSAA